MWKTCSSIAERNNGDLIEQNMVLNEEVVVFEFGVEQYLIEKQKNTEPNWIKYGMERKHGDKYYLDDVRVLCKNGKVPGSNSVLPMGRSSDVSWEFLFITHVLCLFSHL